MRWDDFRRSDNIEDDRNAYGNSYGGGGGFLPMHMGGMGIGTMVVLGLIGYALGIDPSVLIGIGQQLNTGPQYQPTERSVTFHNSKPNDQMGDFVAAVLGNTEDTWSVIFQG